MQITLTIHARRLRAYAHEQLQASLGAPATSVGASRLRERMQLRAWYVLHSSVRLLDRMGGAPPPHTSFDYADYFEGASVDNARPRRLRRSLIPERGHLSTTLRADARACACASTIARAGVRG